VEQSPISISWGGVTATSWRRPARSGIVTRRLFSPGGLICLLKTIGLLLIPVTAFSSRDATTQGASNGIGDLPGGTRDP
jgi:hypothetical protein